MAVAPSLPGWSLAVVWPRRRCGWYVPRSARRQRPAFRSRLTLSVPMDRVPPEASDARGAPQQSKRTAAAAALAGLQWLGEGPTSYVHCSCHASHRQVGRLRDCADGLGKERVANAPMHVARYKRDGQGVVQPVGDEISGRLRQQVGPELAGAARFGGLMASHVARSLRLTVSKSCKLAAVTALVLLVDHGNWHARLACSANLLASLSPARPTNCSVVGIAAT